jgi:hypothetical protein
MADMKFQMRQVGQGNYELPGDPGKSNSGAEGLPKGVGVSNRAATGRKRMDDYEYGVQVHGTISDAMLFIDGYIAPDRALAQAYYLGRLFGNEEEGRSEVVMTEVRDSVLAMIPDLLRIFTQAQTIVQFIPNSKKSVEQADQATDYVNHIFWNDNAGFEIFHNCLKDALTVKTGVIKWHWSDDIEISEADYSGISHDQLMLLQREEDVEILEADPVTKTAAVEMGGNVIVPAEVVYDVRIRRERKKQRVVLECIPPEEFLIDRETRDLDTSRYIGHRSLKTVSDLVDMGYDPDDIESITNSDDSYYLTNLEAITRNPAVNIFSRDTGPNSALKRFVYIESWIRVDRDGDGIAELRHVCSIGPHILFDEVADEIPFAVFCPDPTPHLLIGQSVADQTMDLQLIKSSVTRDLLDSLKQSINPRTVVVEGQVNLDDVLNNEIGNVIRARQPGMVQPLETPFQGQYALPVIQYLDNVKERRTGISDAAAGLDPDALQSATPNAVNNTIQAGQGRKEMVARLFADNGMKRLMKGIYRMVVRHQDKPRIIRLRDQFVEMDPRFWDSDLDCVPNVALGRGSDMQSLAFLAQIKQTQESIIQLLGPDNPLVPVDKYRETLAEMCHLAGFKDETKFFADVTPQQIMQHAQNMPKKQDPTVMLAQIEQQKVQVQAQKNQAQAQQEQQNTIMQHNQAMMKMRLDAAVKLATAQIAATGSFNETQLEALISHDEAISTAQIQAAVDHHANLMQTAVDHGGNAMDAAAQIAQAHIAANAPQAAQ